MKKILLTLLLAGITYSQSWIPQGSGFTFTMTLAYSNAGASDSVETADLDLQYGDMVEIWVLGNSNATGDSIRIRSGAKSYLVAGATPDDTVYGSAMALKDSAGNIQNTIVNNTVGKHYWIYEPLADVLRFELINYRAAVPTRSVTLVIKTRKTQIQ